MLAVRLSRVVAVVAGLGLTALPAVAQQKCPGGPCGPTCPDKKIYPKLEHFYIKKFCGPTIAPGSCFGHFKTQWRSWDDACPGGSCNTPPGVSVYALPPVVATVETLPEVKADVAPPADTKAEDPKLPVPTPKEPAQLPKPPVLTPKEETLPKPTPLPSDPKKDGGKSSMRDAPIIRLPSAPTVPIQTPVMPTTPILLPPVGGQ